MIGCYTLSYGQWDLDGGQDVGVADLGMGLGVSGTQVSLEVALAKWSLDTVLGMVLVRVEP